MKERSDYKCLQWQIHSSLYTIRIQITISRKREKEREIDARLCYICNIHVKLNFLHCDVCNDNNVNHIRRIWQYNQHLVIARCIIGSQANKYRNQALVTRRRNALLAAYWQISRTSERISADLAGLESVIINNCPISMLRAGSPRRVGVTYNRRDDIID